MRSIVVDLGLLVLRISMGCLMLFGHGMDKLLNFTDKAEAFPDPLGIGSTTSLVLAVLAEFGCSLLLAAGLLTRIAVLPLIATMTVAALLVHADDPWKTKELAVVYLAVFSALLITGGGRFALDRLLWNRWRKRSHKKD